MKKNNQAILLHFWERIYYLLLKVHTSHVYIKLLNSDACVLRGSRGRTGYFERVGTRMDLRAGGIFRRRAVPVSLLHQTYFWDSKKNFLRSWGKNESLIISVLKILVSQNSPLSKGTCRMFLPQLLHGVGCRRNAFLLHWTVFLFNSGKKKGSLFMRMEKGRIISVIIFSCKFLQHKGPVSVSWRPKYQC